MFPYFDNGCDTMEYLWLIIAAAGAGIGTGLAGLSAATVMVPIMITLCPSFSGDTGAYQATAIALASDILGSAVTAGVYIRNKNIDLKRGWLMLACIVSMCAVGSFAAWKAGNVVLGGFTLFLTFFIGIKFLIKPDTTRKDTAAKGAKLDFKAAAISVFFGLTIGFGAGFVGSGGGMMMLVVFTAFLGMELKSAVGTSTFIMTFTALIASVSHILIHPAILLEKWLPMLICIVTATVTSLISAKFANKVSNRTVGLVTGAVLTILGAAMILLHYWENLSEFAIIIQVKDCFVSLTTFIIPCASIMILLKLLIKIPDFLFRKFLHIIAFSCLTWMTFHAETPAAAALTSIITAVVIYPILVLFEKADWYSSFFVQKSTHEVRRSLLMLFFMYAAVVFVSWGLFDKKYLCISSILMWGIGDAAAALTGIPFGKHKIHLPLTDGKKSWEGSISMLIFSFAVGCTAFAICGELSTKSSLLIILPGAFTGTLTELFSPSEADTVTVPAVILCTQLLLSSII